MYRADKKRKPNQKPAKTARKSSAIAPRSNNLTDTVMELQRTVGNKATQQMIPRISTSAPHLVHRYFTHPKHRKSAAAVRLYSSQLIKHWKRWLTRRRVRKKSLLLYEDCPEIYQRLVLAVYTEITGMDLNVLTHDPESAAPEHDIPQVAYFEHRLEAGLSVPGMEEEEDQHQDLMTGKDNRFYWDGKLFDTVQANEINTEDLQGTAVFVLTVSGKLFVSDSHIPIQDDQKELGFHHSSFLDGDPVLIAGELEIDQKMIVEIKSQSKDEKPDLAYKMQLFRVLAKAGIDLTHTRLALVEKGEALQEDYCINAMTALQLFDEQRFTDDKRFRTAGFCMQALMMVAELRDLNSAAELLQQAQRVDPNLTRDLFDAWLVPALGRSADDIKFIEYWGTRLNAPNALQVIAAIHQAAIQAAAGSGRGRGDGNANLLNRLRGRK